MGWLFINSLHPLKILEIIMEVELTPCVVMVVEKKNNKNLRSSEIQEPFSHPVET